MAVVGVVDSGAEGNAGATGKPGHTATASTVGATGGVHDTEGAGTPGSPTGPGHADTSAAPLEASVAACLTTPGHAATSAAPDARVGGGSVVGTGFGGDIITVGHAIVGTAAVGSSCTMRAVGTGGTRPATGDKAKPSASSPSLNVRALCCRNCSGDSVPASISRQAMNKASACNAA